ncbi:MAG: outer membrane lipoprotein carrier protein LolA [Flavobacteriaceae bacterium]|nr:outer membrane lipoprotein carrier protein LolA [Flavobacteriaceae bacterium]
MKIFFISNFFLFLSLCIQAQTPEAAKKLLDEVSKTISGFQNLNFDFTYVLENRQENIRQETKGSATISGDFYKLNFLGNEQLFDGEKTYTIIPENEEITISSLEDDNDFGINPSKLLVFYREGYAFQWDIKQNVKNRIIQFVKLIPIEENKDLKYLLLGIDLKTKTIYRLIEITTSQTRTTLTLKNLKTNMTLRPDFFDFDVSKYPDYYIND